LTAFVLFLLAVFVAGRHSLLEISKKWRQAKAQVPQSKPVIQAPLGRAKKLKLLMRPLSLIQYYQSQEQFELVRTLANDRALVIGILAALIAICIHNLVDDLFVHSLTNLIALLLIALIRLERVTPDLSV
jgi:hypothetical protein